MPAFLEEYVLQVNHIGFSPSVVHPKVTRDCGWSQYDGHHVLSHCLSDKSYPNACMGGYLSPTAYLVRCQSFRNSMAGLIFKYYSKSPSWQPEITAIFYFQVGIIGENLPEFSGERMPRHKSSKVFPISPDEIIKDYRLAYQSRQASVIGRREVLSGKAKFGIFGDGKELAQLAIARAFRKGDWRSGYYRDQTWMLMLGVTGLNGYFAQLYAHADVNYEPATAGRAISLQLYIPRCVHDEASGWRQKFGY